MATENEPAKLLLPYLQRADELQKHEPLVSYYCRLYAMERGLKFPQSDRTKTTNALLVSLMKQLEKDKKSLNLGPDDHLQVEGFCLNVFSRADKQDRAGRADFSQTHQKNNLVDLCFPLGEYDQFFLLSSCLAIFKSFCESKAFNSEHCENFYAASIFFEILNQFGEVQPDLEEKQKYAAWKAADIRKALKEGKKPIPGPPGRDKDLSSTSSGEFDLEQRRSDFASMPDPTRLDRGARIPPDSVSSPQAHTQDNPQQQTMAFSRQPSNVKNFLSDNSLHQPPSTNNSEQHSIYHHHSYPDQHFPSQDVPSASYSNLQSYPSFTESTLPTEPTHYHSFPDASSHQKNSNGGNESVSEIPPPTMRSYEHDNSYQPPPEKIAEAHKAARFAVGALAFDDVSIAVEHLKKSLELLTNPAAEH